MIRVDYRPLHSLSPLHQAILVAVDKLPSPVGSFDCLSLPKILVEPALEDLLAWGFLVRKAGEYALLDPGKECVQVWKDTSMTGSWEIDDPVGWELGKGKFWILANCACLGDVGFNQENGRWTTYPDAVALHGKFKEVHIFLESGELQKMQGKLFGAVDPGLGKNNQPSLSEFIGSTLTSMMDNPQLESAASQIRTGLDGLSNSDGLEADVAEARAGLEEALHGQREKLRWKSQELATAKDILLAHWLQQQQGLLGELAQKSPSSLMVESTFGYPPEPKPVHPPTLADNQAVVSPGSHPPETQTSPPTEDAKPNPSSGSGSMFRKLLRLFRS